MKKTLILNLTILALLLCSLIPLSFGASLTYATDVQVNKAPLQTGIILFDESHTPGGTPAHTIAGAYSTFAADLTAQGYTVQAMSTWNSTTLMTASVLVTVNPQVVYSVAERLDIHTFLAQGGGLFIIGESTGSGFADELAAWYNVTFASDWLADYNDHGPSTMNINWTKVSNFGHHSITSGVTYLQTYAGAGLLYYPLGATPLMIMDVDDYSRYFISSNLASGMAAMVAFDYQYGAGRVVVTGDSDQFSDNDADTNAALNYDEGANALLARNIIEWLSHAAIPNKWVVYDESHAPFHSMAVIPSGFTVVFDESHGQGFLIDADNDGVYGHTDDDSGYGDWARMLEANGFTVANMSTWNSGLVSSADVLVVGNSFFTPDDVWSPSEIDDVQNFVINGGGLLFLGEQITQLRPGFRDVVKTFGVEFFDGAISDSDDHYSTIDYWVKFDGNNLATDHPALNGVKEVPHLWGNALNNTPAGATTLLVTDDDGSAGWYTTPPGSPSGQNLPCMTAFDYGQGRVIVGGDTHYFVNNSVVFALPYGNASTFSISIIRWLSEVGYNYGQYYNLRETLIGAGYGVISMFDFPSSLGGGVVAPGRPDALILSGSFVQYSASERATIQSYVEIDGGSLFLIGDIPVFLGFTSEIAEDFGIRFEYAPMGFLIDSDDYFGEPFFSLSDVIYETPNFATHPITAGLNQIIITGATGINNQPSSATTLVQTDGDATATWANLTAAPNYPVMSALMPNRGRLVTIGASWQFTRWILTSSLHGNNKTMILDYYDNRDLLLNTMAWLTSNRAPLVTLVQPDGGENINGTYTIQWTHDDYDGQPLTTDLFYSFDNGSTWHPIVTGLDNTSFVWNTIGLPNSDQYRIRVVVNDGDLTSEAISTSSFTVFNFIFLPPDFPWLLIIAAIIIIVVIIVLVLVLRRRGSSK